MDDFFRARWYTLRRSGSLKPATYRCPLCGERMPALIDHVLVFPEDDHSRRRHAHIACVQKARAAGRLPTRDEVEPRPPGLFARLFKRGG